MVRTSITIDGATILLSQNQDLEALKACIVAAAAGPGAWVDFIVVGNRRQRVTVTPSTSVIISVETVPFDYRETGDESAAFNGKFNGV